MRWCYYSDLKISKDKNNITTYKYETLRVKFYPELYADSSDLWLQILQFALQFVAPTTLFVSFISLVFASIDRFVALTFPFKYKQTDSTKIAKVASAFIWVFSATFQILTVILCGDIDDTPSVLFQPTYYVYHVVSPKYACYLNQNINAAVLFILFSLLWLLTFMPLFRLYKNYKNSLSLNRKGKSLFRKTNVFSSCFYGCRIYI